MSVRRSIEIVVLCHAIPVLMFCAFMCVVAIDMYGSMYDTKFTFAQMQQHVFWASAVLACFLAALFAATRRLIRLLRQKPTRT